MVSIPRHFESSPVSTLHDPQLSLSAYSSLLGHDPPYHQSTQLKPPGAPDVSCCTFVETTPSQPDSCMARSEEEGEQERKAAETLMALSTKRSSSNKENNSKNDTTALVVDLSTTTCPFPPPATSWVVGSPEIVSADIGMGNQSLASYSSSNNKNNHHATTISTTLKRRKVTPHRGHGNFHHQLQYTENIEEEMWRRNSYDLSHYVYLHGAGIVNPSPFQSRWYHEQRVQYFFMRMGRRTTLTTQRYMCLQSLGFPFIQGEWFRGLDQFLRFTQQYGCLSKLYLWTDKNERPKLSDWVYVQKSLYENHHPTSLSVDEINLLDACGIIQKVAQSAEEEDSASDVESVDEAVDGSSSAAEDTDNSFDSRCYSWKLKYEQLCKFQKWHGHCLVRRSHPTLGRWVACQRVQYNLMKAGRHHNMNDERIDALNAIGFVWDQSQDAKWTARYKRLLQYKKDHGDCLVPQRYPADPGLGSWVAGQRRLYRLQLAGRGPGLMEDRVKLLKKAGFVWHCKSAYNGTIGLRTNM